MRTVILGATGQIGLALTHHALQAGHEVVAMVRQPEKLGALADRVSVVVGDYLNPADQIKALAGADAVLTTIGPPMSRAPRQQLAA